MKQNNKFLIGILMCLVAVVAWGGMFPVMGSALKVMDPFYFTLFRYGIASIIFVFLLTKQEGKKKLSPDGAFKKVTFLGTMGFAGFSFLVFLGQQLAGQSGAVIAAVIMAVQPLLGALVLLVTKKIVPKPLTFFFMVSGLVGVVMVISKGDLSVFVSEDTNLLAYLFILLGALCFVIYTMGAGTFPGWSPLRYSAVTSIFGTISITVIVGLATFIGWLKVPTLTMVQDISGELMYMSLIAGVMAFFAWNIGNKIITPINGILFMNMVPVTTFIISVIQGYQLTTFELIGALITIASLVGNNLYVRKVNHRTSAQTKLRAAQ
ncbi:DMT family transporter [Halobacillus sp. HZG1]|uniref:DMT family transporter n=1 Tax=Halobacillus sp. HZG1 TaxID=3111769 RepID=UPI002DBE8654|nr:DMT family transporter [Halobacillus sp. HZG1]MEC3883373.1 DMT family transporter [Halobacillus sp. HZG1]